MDYWKIHYLENSLKKYIEIKNKQAEESSKDSSIPSTSQIETGMRRKMAANMSSISKQMSSFNKK